jgi:hypothetical protein
MVKPPVYILYAIGTDLLEEAQRSGSDGDRTLSVPGIKGIIKLLGGGSGTQVPGLAIRGASVAIQNA